MQYDCQTTADNFLSQLKEQHLSLTYGLVITGKIYIALNWGPDNSWTFSITILGPIIFSMIFFQSFLPVVAWKTLEKTRKISTDSKNMMLNIWLFMTATNNYRHYKRLPAARHSLKIWSHLWAKVIVWYFSVGIKSLHTYIYSKVMWEWSQEVIKNDSTMSTEAISYGNVLSCYGNHCNVSI